MPPARVAGGLSLDPTRQLLRNASWLLASDGTVSVAGLLGTLVAARALGAPEFGRITLVWSVVGVAHLLTDVRAWEAVTRYLSEFTSRHEPGLALATLKLAILVEAAVAVLGFGLVWLTSAWVATRFFGDPSLASGLPTETAPRGSAAACAARRGVRRSRAAMGTGLVDQGWRRSERRSSPGTP
jgi:Polysaccharide biosynthesis protein